MVYKGATDYIETIFVQKGQKKKKKSPQTPRDKRQEETQERKIQKSRKKLKDKRLASYIQGGKRTREMKRAFKSISPHSPGDNWIGTNNKHSMRLLRGLKRQQWYEDWLLPMLRERNKLVLGTRDRSTTQQALGQLPSVCVEGDSSGQSQPIFPIFPQSLCALDSR